MEANYVNLKLKPVAEIAPRRRNVLKFALKWFRRHKVPIFTKTRLNCLKSLDLVNALKLGE